MSATSTGPSTLHVVPLDSGPWPRLAHAERAGFPPHIADAIDRRAPELAAILASQMGVVCQQALLGCRVHSRTFRTYAAMADMFLFEERHTPDSGGVGLLVREPAGVVGAIIQWNEPLGLISGDFTKRIAPQLGQAYS